MRKILVVGASGVVGREIVSEFLDDKECDEVVTWVRKVSGVKHEKLREKVINFDEILTLKDECFDAVFCALGTTIKQAKSAENFKKVDVIYPVNLAKWAKRSGCENFTLISAPKANINSKFLYLRAKGEAEKGVKEQGFKSLSIIHPPLINGERKDKRYGEKFMILLFEILPKCWFKNIRPMSGKDIAKATIKVAKIAKSGVNFYHPQEILAPNN